MSLVEDLAQVEASLAGLLQELHTLRQRVAMLESQNEHLRARLYEREQRGGAEQLARLYGEGFHICPPQFARSRTDGQDCLFCLSFLERQRTEAPFGRGEAAVSSAEQAGGGEHR